ncbi:MAG: PadR family transcriptional regulator [Acidobacteria bacterium]|nr:PadR family transcriptional regulator [Acidobacteriota bacterium]
MINAYTVDMGNQNLLGSFEQLVLLAVLQIGEDAYAPAIRERLETKMQRNVARGAVYVTLDRLEQRGLLASTSAPAEPGRGGRPRRHVAVTPEGVRQLKEVRGYLDALWDGLDTVRGD